jgi:peptidoglycan/xylan/chitin deacetylase (PgdA/CDA1 family)
MKEPLKQAVPDKTFAFKRFPVLEYHHIRRPEGRWSRTPENFRKDLEWLWHNNYYPMDLRDILNGFKGLPEGKVPVILTFDDSPSNQFRYLPDGSIDPECAVGIIQKFHKEHPREWPMRATFFVLIQTNDRNKNIFGQPERPEHKEKKLRQMTEWGMEVASHTYSHERLSDISPDAARYALARSYKKLKELTGEEIVSIALPMGLYPEDESVFSGHYQKIKYNYRLACEVAGGLQPVPGSPAFRPLHINRIQAIDTEWHKFFGR